MPNFKLNVEPIETIKPNFKPIPVYSQIGDMLTVFWEDGGPNDYGYADQVNSQITVIRAMSDQRPIGVKVYGIKELVRGTF